MKALVIKVEGEGTTYVYKLLINHRVVPLLDWGLQMEVAIWGPFPVHVEETYPSMLQNDIHQ